MRKHKLRTRQRIFLSTRMKIVAGVAVSALSIFLLIIYFNFFDIKDTRAFSTGDYRSVSSGNWDDVTVWEVFDGENWNPASQPPGDGVKKILVTNNQKMIVTDEIPINQLVIDFGSQVTVESNTVRISKFNNNGGLTCNGTLELGSSILEGNGDFILGPDAVLMIGSDAGIDKKATSGNIQMTGKREYHKDATYVFNGSVTQHSGNALPSIVKNLVIDNASGVILDQQLQILNKLSLIKGVLNTGKFTMTLGNSVQNTCLLESETGVMSGSIKIWFSPKNSSLLKFPLSDGFTDYTICFNSVLPAFQKGMIELVYRDGVPDDAHKSPFEARQVVVAISERGYFSAMLSNGPEEAWLQLSGIKETAGGIAEIVWDIRQKSDSAEAAYTTNKSPGKEIRPKSISNILYGPVPFKNQLVVRFYCENKTSASFQLMNPKGKVVKMENLQVEPGYNQFVFDATSELSPGAYMIQISNPSEIHTFKVMCNAKAESVTGI